MDWEVALEKFHCSEDEEEFHERFMIIQRMNAEPEFAKKIAANYKPVFDI